MQTIITNNKTIRILIAEDDEILSKLLKKNLLKKGYHVENAYNGKSVIKYIEKYKDVLILLDYKFEDLNAKQIIKILKKKNYSVPFIIITGYDDVKKAVDMMKLGAKDYLIKHANLVKLLPDVVERVLQDIKKEKRLKRVEKAHRESEKRFKILFDFSFDLISIFDTSLNPIWFNPSWNKALGYSLNNQENFLNIIHDDDKVKFQEEWNQKKKTQKEIINMELRLKTINNTYIHLLVSINFIELDEKRYIYIVAHNITERIKTENALKESETRYRRITNAITDYVYTVSIKDGKPVKTDHNSSCYSITGYREKEFENDPYLWIKMVHPNDIVEVKKQIDEILEKKEFNTITHRIIKKNGEIKWIQNTPVGQFDDKGNIISYDGIIRDITNIKTAEEKIKKLNEELEERVYKRTKQLEETNNELESFAYSVSHDLRAPLRHISGFTELLKNEISEHINVKSKNFLTKIIDSISNMNKLIDNLLSLSKMGRSKINNIEIDINKIIQEILELHNEEIRKRKIVFKISNLPSIKGDNFLIKQVIYNLISNAIKYTKLQKKALIKIDYEIINNKEIIYSIRDNGVGFNMKYADKMFGVFQRLHDQKQFEGSGIGLAIVKRIISRHNGRVWTESEENKGSTFYFSLPII